MDNKTRGIYNKFNVARSDGQHMPGCKHHGCEYFVLDMTHDPFAIEAAEAYADACEDEYPQLAKDLRESASCNRSFQANEST